MGSATVIALGVAAATAFAAVNALAYMQARAMTHFVPGGARTKSPEELSALEAARALVAGVNIPKPGDGRTPAAVGLAFETHRFATPDGGPTLEAWLVPADAERPLVLVFHGYAASKSALIPIAAALHELEYPALLVDFYGSGGSSGSGTSLGFLEARDVAATVAFARERWPERKLAAYGFSMGGAAILRAISAEGVEPDAIIVEATFDRLLNTAKNRFHTMGVPATPLAQMLLFWGGLEWGFDAFSLNPADYARAVACPALILQGGSDARVSLAQADNLRRAIADAQLVEFPGVPHMLIVEAQTEDWKRAVGEFLARL